MFSALGLKKELINEENYYRFKIMIHKWKINIMEANAKNRETIKKAWENFKKILINWGYNVSLKDNRVKSHF